MQDYSKITVVPYNHDWPVYFQQEAQKLQQALGNYLQQIHHIGSTALPGIHAKPVIDILFECDNIDQINLINQQLQQLHYQPVQRSVIPYRSFFTQRQGQDISFHCHIYERGDPQVKRHINFRDYLLHHADAAKDYAALKIRLAEQFANDRYAYVCGKAQFVQDIDCRAKRWSNKKFLASNTELTVNNASPERLMQAMVANLNLHMTYFAQYLKQVELIRVPGYTLVNSNLMDDTFNYVLDADFAATEADNKIKDISHYFTRNHIPFSWWLSPTDKPEDLATRLANQGYQNTENNIAMYFDLDSWDSKTLSIPELTIIRALDEKTLRDFALVLANDAAAFKEYFSWIAANIREDDPIEYYVGYVDGKPVTRGLSCYYAGVVGLHWLSTAPDERKKGYGVAMQQFRLRRAKELGYHIAVLQASHEGYPLYQRLGYKECGVFKEYKLVTE